jgi:Lysyl oxidase
MENMLRYGRRGLLVRAATALALGSVMLPLSSGGCSATSSGSVAQTSPPGSDAHTTTSRDASVANSNDATVDPPVDAAAPSTSDAQMCVLGGCAPGGPCPDLTVDQDLLASSVILGELYFPEGACELQEHCVGAPGNRKLLRFDMGTINQGTGDLSLGDPVDNSACFHWSECHMHYHFQGFALYQLYSADESRVITSGGKMAFCIEDVDQAPSSTLAPVPESEQYTCANQGLHVGYMDIYPIDKACQWVDITGVPAGNYVLSVTVNFEHIIAESDYTNNEVRVPVTIE